MAATLLRIHPENPPQNRIQQVVDVLRRGGIIIYPTDTVYGIGCDIHNAKAVDKLCRIKGLNPEKAMLSFICADLSQSGGQGSHAGLCGMNSTVQSEADSCE